MSRVTHIEPGLPMDKLVREGEIWGKTGTAEIRFLGRDTVFYGSAVHLSKTTKCRQFSVVFAPSLYDIEKSTKLRADTVTLAFKFRPFVG